MPLTIQAFFRLKGILGVYHHFAGIGSAQILIADLEVRRSVAPDVLRGKVRNPGQKQVSQLVTNCLTFTMGWHRHWNRLFGRSVSKLQ